MAKGNTDLVDRLRMTGMRKEVARTIIGLVDTAAKAGTSSKVAKPVARVAAELRDLAHEIEQRATGGSQPTEKPKAKKGAGNTEAKAPAKPKAKSRDAAPRAQTAATSAAKQPRKDTQTSAKPAATKKASPKKAPNR